MPAAADLVLRRGRINAHRELCDIAVANGRIVAVGHDLQTRPGASEVDCGGHVVIPGFVEPHIHLDKALLSDRYPNQSGTLQEALQVTRRQKREFTPEDVRT